MSRLDSNFKNCAVILFFLSIAIAVLYVLWLLILKILVLAVIIVEAILSTWFMSKIQKRFCKEEASNKKADALPLFIENSAFLIIGFINGIGFGLLIEKQIVKRLNASLAMFYLVKIFLDAMLRCKYDDKIYTQIKWIAFKFLIFMVIMVIMLYMPKQFEFYLGKSKFGILTNRSDYVWFLCCVRYCTKTVVA